MQKELQERKRKKHLLAVWTNQWVQIQAEVSQKDFFIWIWFLFQKKERNGVYGSFVKYPKEMDNPCDETLPSVFHIFPTITINFFQDFLRKKMIKKGHIFGMELILITKCIFVNHEVNLIWFQSLFFLAKNIFSQIRWFLHLYWQFLDWSIAGPG